MEFINDYKAKPRRELYSSKSCAKPSPAALVSQLAARLCVPVPVVA